MEKGIPGASTGDQKRNIAEVMIGDRKIGGGRPAICAVVAEERAEDLPARIREACESPCDLIEWRADALLRGRSRGGMWGLAEELAEVGREVRAASDKPIIFTVRTRGEGGSADLTDADYALLIRECAEAVPADAIDIQAFTGSTEYEDEKMSFLVSLAREQGKTVLLSYHDFTETPEVADIVRRMCVMQSMGADLVKIAVMPSDEEDVHRLLEAARVMQEHYAERPFIAISMGELGQVSRICGGAFGSAVSYASVRETTAPGQMSVRQLAACLREYYPL